MYGARLYGTGVYAGKRSSGRNLLTVLTDVITVTASKVGTQFYKTVSETLVVTATITLLRSMIRVFSENTTITATITTLYTRAWQAVSRLATTWDRQSRSNDESEWVPTEKQF